MDLRTDRLAVGGEAVARASDGRVVFVEGAAPRERVRVEVTTERDRFLRARVLEVLEPSPDRVVPRCPHADVCGGCALQHLEPAAQTTLKVEAAVEALRRLGRVDVPDGVVEAPWRGPPYGYRARARWQARGGRFGYFERRSRRVVDVQSCPVLVPALESARPELAAAWPSGRRGEVRALAVEGTVGVWSAEAADWRPEAAVVLPPGQGLETTDAAGPIVLGPATFAQANPAGNDAMLTALKSWAPEVDLALELYSGGGNWTRVLESIAKRVIAAEVDASAVALAEAVRGGATELWPLPAARAVARANDEGLEPDLVLVNPTRTGLDRGLPEAIADLGPSTVVYVSCDAPTLGRDLGRFAARGYAIRRLRFFDLYPQTPHLEALTVLEH